MIVILCRRKNRFKFCFEGFTGITFSVEIIINQFLLLVTTTKDQKTTLAKVEREAGKFVIFTSEFDLKGQNNISEMTYLCYLYLKCKIDDLYSLYQCSIVFILF